MSSKTTTAPAVTQAKRRAKAIKKQTGTPHHEALDAAARESGYQNFRHLQNTAPAASASKPVQLIANLPPGVWPSEFKHLTRSEFERIRGLAMRIYSSTVEVKKLKDIQPQPSSLILENPPEHLKPLARDSWNGATAQRIHQQLSGTAFEVSEDRPGDGIPTYFEFRLQDVPPDLLPKELAEVIELHEKRDELHALIDSTKDDVANWMQTLSEQQVAEFNALIDLGDSESLADPLAAAIKRMSRLPADMARDDALSVVLSHPWLLEVAAARISASSAIRAILPQNRATGIPARGVLEEICTLSAACEALLKVSEIDDLEAYRQTVLSVLINHHGSESLPNVRRERAVINLLEHLQSLDKDSTAQLLAMGWAGMGAEEDYDYLVSKGRLHHKDPLLSFEQMSLHEDLPAGLKLLIDSGQVSLSMKNSKP